MISAALAYEIEEEFPQKEKISQAIAIYKKSLACQSKMGEEYRSDLGTYRLGLLARWQNDLETSNEALKTLIDSSDNNLLLGRAKYWLNQNKRLEDKSISRSSQLNQFKDHPLAYHSLINFDEKEASRPFEEVSDLDQEDSKSHSENAKLNTSAEIYMALNSLNETGLAKRVLEFIDLEALKKAEPEFQLFIAEELHRFEELKHEKFKVLANLFQNHPNFKSIQNLKLFYPIDYASLIVKNTQDENPYMVFALIRQESSFNPNTESPVGARGLMQLMPRTAREIKKNIQEEQLFDPAHNVRLGSIYLHRLIRQFDGDVAKALASYNAGAGNVRKWTKRYPIDDSLLFADLIPFDETREYVSNILRNKYWYEKLYPQNKIEGAIAQAQTDK